MTGREDTDKFLSYREEETDSDGWEEGAAALEKKAEGTGAGSQPQSPLRAPRKYYYEADGPDGEIKLRMQTAAELESEKVVQTLPEEEIYKKKSLQEAGLSWGLEIPTDYPRSNMGEYSTMLADSERREADRVWPPKPSAGRGYSL